MILSIHFDRSVPWSRDRRSQVFDASEWVIHEESPGRVHLLSEYSEIVVQDVPYTLFVGPDLGVEADPFSSGHPYRKLAPEAVINQANLRPGGVTAARDALTIGGMGSNPIPATKVVP